MKKAARYLSVPWLVTVFVFGLLPWSEVSCNAKEINLRATQSGYQTLYGGVSSPSKIMEVAKEEADQTQEALTKSIEMAKADLLVVCSPFAAVFWAACLATLLLVCSSPPSRLRLQCCTTLVVVMAAMMIIQWNVGTPLERRVDGLLHEAIKADPQKAMVLAAGINSGVTVWFWLTLTAVVLTGATEFLSDLLGQQGQAAISSTAPIGAIALAALLAMTGVAAQFVYWGVGIERMEAQLAELKRPEQERIAKAEADERERQRQQREEEARRQAEEQRQQAEQQRKAAELEKQRLAEEKALKERAEQERHEGRSRRTTCPETSRAAAPGKRTDKTGP